MHRPRLDLLYRAALTARLPIVPPGGSELVEARMTNRDLGLEFPRFDVDSGRSNHPREIAALNLIRIDENQVPNAKSGEVFRHQRTNPAEPDDSDPARAQDVLSSRAEHTHLPVVFCVGLTLSLRLRVVLIFPQRVSTFTYGKGALPLDTGISVLLAGGAIVAVIAGGPCARISDVRDDVGSLRQDVNALRDDVHEDFRVLDDKVDELLRISTRKDEE